MNASFERVGSLSSAQDLPVPPAAPAARDRGTTGRRARWLLPLVVLALCGLRFVHLTADTPGWISPTSAGEYVDEGYKTLSPRNLALFGRTHWHPNDDYTGWMKTSPVTNWSYFAAFRVGGPDLATARVVTIIYFGLFLLAFVWAFQSRYPPVLVLGGLLLFGLDATFFFFSRIALFEVPIVFLLYAWLFLLTRVREQAVWGPLVATLLLSPLLAFGVKLSALVYLAPVWAALLARAVALRGWPRSPWVTVGLIVGAVGVGVMLMMTHWLWSERIALNPLRYVPNLLANPLTQAAPFLLLAGWLAALHLVLTRVREVVASPYRAAVVALALLGPLAFGLFPYDPPRYYVPILPAFVLVICEWFILNGRRLPIPGRGAVTAVVAIAGLTLWFHAALRIANDLVLAHLPIMVGESPGIGKRGLLVVGLPLAIAAATIFWFRRPRWLSGPVIQGAIVGSLVLWAAHAMVRVGDFLVNPRFEGDSVRTAIAAAVPPQSSIGGDWAPFFALGTDLRPLYVNRRFNRAQRLHELRPDYFLHSETADSEASLEVLVHRPDVQLGEPLLTTEYNDREVVLYQLGFSTPAAGMAEGAGAAAVASGRPAGDPSAPNSPAP